MFLVLGATAFGGPASHIGYMQRECVERRRWTSRETFIDLIGTTAIIPGPNSTELAMLLGRARAGLPGLVMAGCCFVLPAALIVGLLAAAYSQGAALPWITALRAALAPVVVGIVAHALVKLVPVVVRSWRVGVIGAVSLAAVAAGVPEVAVLVAAGVVSWGTARAAGGALVAAPVVAAATAGAAAAGSPGIAAVLAYFLRVGSVIFGSGYVLFAFLHADLVQARAWVTEAQLVDAIAIGQVTPGPLFTTATFIGYLVGGWAGAIAATVGIFLPAFLLSAASHAALTRLQASPAFRLVLDGINAASLALMVLVTWELGRVAVTGWVPTSIALGSLGILLATRINPMWLVLAAAAFAIVRAG